MGGLLMFCSKCGSKIPDGAKFCANCGQATQQAAGAASGPSGSMQGAGGADGVVAGGSTEKRGLGKGRLRKGFAVLAAAVAVILFAGFFIKANAWRLMSAKSYYGYLESRSGKISLNKLYRDSMKAAEVKPFSKDIVFTIDSIGTDAGIRGRLLEEFSLNLKIDHDKNKTAGYVSVEIMDNELVDALFYRDRKTVGFGIPLLYDDYFRCDIDKLSTTISKLTGNDMPEITVADKSPEQYRKEMDKDTRLLDERLAKYLKTLMNSIPGSNFSKKSEDDVTIYTWAGGRRKKAAEFKNCRTVRFTVAEKDLYVAFDRVLADLEKDDEFIGLLAKYYDAGQLLSIGRYRNYYGYESSLFGNDENDPESVIKNWITETRENLGDIFDPEDDYPLMEVKVIADSKDNIIFRQIITDYSFVSLATYSNPEGFRITELNAAGDEYDEERTAIYLYSGRKGKGAMWHTDFGTGEISFMSSGEGKSDIGMEYGMYKLKMSQMFSSYELDITAEKDQNEKNTDLLRLRLYVDNERIGSVKAVVRDLKDKSKLTFNKNKAKDISELDQYDLMDIGESIKENFEAVVAGRMESFLGW